MNTLADLRSTLEAHAGFDDVDRDTRLVAVRARVRTTRRRRAGAAAGTAAVVLLAATAVVGGLRGASTPEPAGPSLDDVDVPQRVEVHGFPYELTATPRVARDGSVALDDADGPRAATLVATGLGSGEATLWSGLVPVARVRGDEQVSTLTTDVGDDLRVELDGAPASARAEVAVYTPTGELAPGVTSDGAVFRQQVGDQELVTAAFAAGGDVASASVPDGSERVEVALYCRSAGPDVWIHAVGIRGEWRCTDLEPGNDPGAVNQDLLASPRAGDRTYGVYATQGQDGPRATGVDVTVGFGLYRSAVAPRQVLGGDVPSVVEAQGLTWRLDDVLEPDDRGTFEVDTSDGDAYIGVQLVGVSGMSVTWRGAPEGGWGGTPPGTEPNDLPETMYPGRLLAGDHTVRVPVTGTDAQVRLLVYRPE